MLNSSIRFGAVGLVHVQNVRVSPQPVLRVPLHAPASVWVRSVVQRSAEGESARLS